MPHNLEEVRGELNDLLLKEIQNCAQDIELLNDYTEEQNDSFNRFAIKLASHLDWIIIKYIVNVYLKTAEESQDETEDNES